MNERNMSSLAIAVVFTWVGFVCAISFMEAWLKFTAPGITLPLGLGIGKVVFGALNKVEWVFAFIIIAGIIASGGQFFSRRNILVLTVILILALQTLWLLPALSQRADDYIKGCPVGPSILHIYFVIAEILKVAALIFSGRTFLKKDSRAENAVTAMQRTQYAIN